MLNDRLHHRVNKQIHLERVVALAGAVQMFHVPLELDVEADVLADRVEDELQRWEWLMVIVRFLLKRLMSGRLLGRVKRLKDVIA